VAVGYSNKALKKLEPSSLALAILFSGILSG
jgi:hypothetical protein